MLEKIFVLEGTPEVYGVFWTHDPWLVALSVLLAVALSIMAMHLAGLAARATSRAARRIIITTGALAQGGGIWAMHFVGMLALPFCAGGRFEPWVTALSVLPSLLAAWAALTVLSRPQVSRGALLLGGVLMGAGIGVMHYMGMAASEFLPHMRYDVGGFAFSIVFAVGVAYCALWLRFRLERVPGLPRWLAVWLGGMVMGVAIAGMHYIATAALRVLVVHQSEGLSLFGAQIRSFPAWVVELVGERASVRGADPAYLAWAIALLAVALALAVTSVNTNLRARSLLRQSRAAESRQRAVLDTAVDAVILINGQGAIQSFNPAAERLFGWALPEVVGQNVKMLMPDPYRAEHDFYLQRHLSTGHTSVIGQGREVQGQRKDGSVFPMRLAVGRVQQPGEPLFVGFVTDLTERERLERERQRGARLMQSLLANLPGVAFRCRNEPGWAMEFMSEPVLQLTGWSAEEFVQNQVNLRDLMTAEHRELVEMEVAAALQAGSAYQVEYPICGRNGHWVWVAESGRGVADEDGQLRWIDAVMLDITANRARSAEFAGTVAAIDRSQAVVEFDMSGHLIRANDNYLQLMGYTMDELIGLPHRYFCLPEYVKSPAYAEFWQQLRHGLYQAGEFERLGKEGRQVLLYATYNPIFDAEGKPFKIIKIAADLSQRRAMEQDLRAAKEQAEQAAEARASFLANMSHEIRTPMNAIIGFTDALLDTPLQPQQKRQLTTVQHSARSLLRLLNDILDTAKLDKGAMELEQAAFDLRALCEQILASLRINADKKGLALTLSFADATPQYWLGDAFRLQQVLLNLLGNAVKFTHHGGVQLRISGQAGALEIAVQDSGIGMDEAAQARLFNPFSQADASTTRRYGGTGLGTNIARQLVDLMGGRISVHSQPGQGSTFTLQLPLLQAQAQQVLAAQQQAQSCPQLPPLRVLAADDVLANLELLQIHMQRLGHSLVCADGGSAALQAFTQQPFDVVLMDLQMPEVDGMQATRSIRAWERAQGRAATPIIALSASVLEQDRQNARAAGMDGFADKPLDPQRLLTEIARVLGLQAQAALALPEAGAAQPASTELIDWPRGLTLWGQEASLRQAIARLLADASYEQQLQAAVQTADASALAAAAHKLHGAAANLALPGVQAQARALEAAAADPGQSPQWPVLLSNLEQAMAAVRALLADLPDMNEGAAPAPQPSVLDAAQRAQIAAALAQVRSSLEQGELPDVALAQLPSLLPSARLQALHEAIDSFDFDAALQQVQQLHTWIEEPST